MRRFLSDSQAAWADLSRRASRACVVFGDCELPPGCQPARARVGFEVRSGEAILFVDRGIRYDGDSPAVSAWLASGETRFPELGDLKSWILQEIGPLFQRSEVSPRTPAELTDLNAVTATPPAHAGAHVDSADLLRELRSRVFGQDDALQVVAARTARHVRRSRPRRPATLFALGPTGVGKTRTAEALAESLGALVDRKWSSLIRLNMNEYQERHRVSQLLGAPPGYVGYHDGTPLTYQLAAQPERVLLFDEIEKAHPDILVALMSAMDTGEFPAPTAAERGRPIDCRRAVFFFTSNIDIANATAELESSSAPDEVAGICRRHLVAGGVRPELVGRISAFLMFRPISDRARSQIAVAAVLAVGAEYGLRVTWVAPEVVSSVVSRPYGNLGARPDEYYIDELLGPAFSRYLSSGGPPTIRIECSPVPTCLPVPGDGRPPEIASVPLCTITPWSLAGGRHQVLPGRTGRRLGQRSAVARCRRSGPRGRHPAEPVSRQRRDRRRRACGPQSPGRCPSARTTGPQRSRGEPHAG